IGKQRLALAEQPCQGPSPLIPRPPDRAHFAGWHRSPPGATLFPYTTLFRSIRSRRCARNKWPGPLHSTPSARAGASPSTSCAPRSEEHTSELQSRFDLVCRPLLEKKNSRPEQAESHTLKREGILPYPSP